MKLDRNLNGDGRGKYGLILNRRLKEIADTAGVSRAHDAQAHEVGVAMAVLTSCGVIDWGDTVDTEFFVMRLRDAFASSALQQYAHAAMFFAANRKPHLQDYANDVTELAHRSSAHPNKKWPD